MCENPCPVGECNWHVTKAYLGYEQPSTSEVHSDPWVSLSFGRVKHRLFLLASPSSGTPFTQLWT